MHSIKVKITAITVCIMVIAMSIAAVLGVTALRNIGHRNAEHELLLLCETGQKNLNHYFQNVEQSVTMLSTIVKSDLNGLDDEQLQAHVNRINAIFNKAIHRTNGVLTYYYRIDPSVSQNVQGFWYINDGEGVYEHAVTDINRYNTNDTSQLPWFTIPKAAGKAVWLPPYITDNLGARVIAYCVPIYYGGKFVGVVGMEIDYTLMAQEVNNITLYDHGYAFLNDAEGNIIYHPRMDVMTMDEPPQVPAGLLSKNKFIHYTFNDVEKQAVWLPLSNDMHLNVTVPVQEINADWYNWSIEIIVIFAVLLAIFITIIMVYIDRIIHPLQTLTLAAEQINQGNYNVELDYDQDDEIGLLTRTFKKVTMNLNDYIRNLNNTAFIDALTGIRNRQALRQDYNLYLGHEVTVMMMDINDFKTTNDTFGHEEGDRVLQETGKLLRDTFGADHCYRYGGDEFLVIVPDISLADFQTKLDSMLPHRPVIAGTPVNFSCGVTQSNLQGSDVLRTLISDADEKMYASKRDSKSKQTKS